MIVLALDTACEICAAALMRDNVLLAATSDVLGKGHAEFLPGQIEAIIKEAGVSFNDIDRIAVNIGPGSFTGIRVGVAMARGLALALKKTAVGVNNLEVSAFEAIKAFPAHPVVVIQEAAFDRFFVAAYDQNGHETTAPQNCGLEDIKTLLLPKTVLTGSGAQKIADALQADITIFTKPHADIATFALIGGSKPVAGKPAPLYLRAPDAKPQSGFALARKE